MEHPNDTSVRHELLNGMNSLRVACEALDLPLQPADAVIYLDDIRCACDAIDHRLEELAGPREELQRVAPFQWLMDPSSFPSA